MKTPNQPPEQETIRIRETISALMEELDAFESQNFPEPPDRVVGYEEEA